MPTIPATPDNTGGAGRGNFISLNKIPTMIPANNAKSTSFILFLLVHFILHEIKRIK